MKPITILCIGYDTLDVVILIYSTREHMPSCLRPGWGQGAEMKFGR